MTRSSVQDSSWALNIGQMSNSKGAPQKTGLANNTAVETVYVELRLRIATGKYPPGTILTQAGVGDDLGMSRTPVRHALKRLEADGVLTVTDSGRCRVIAPGDSEIAHIYSLRIFCETLGARLTVPHLSTEELGQLRLHLDKMGFFEEQSDYVSWQNEHDFFHAILVKAAPSMLKAFTVDLRARAEPYRKIFTTGILGAWRLGMNDHHSIFVAASSRDVEEVGRTLADHYARVARMTIALIESDNSKDNTLIVRETLALLKNK